APTATESALNRESLAIARLPRATESCSIPQHAAANASTATRAWVKSCRANVAPTGCGHPAEHVTWEEMKKKPHAASSDTAGAHARSTATCERRSRLSSAMTAPPATNRRRAASNHAAVGSPTAPNSLTYIARGRVLSLSSQMMTRDARTVTTARAARTKSATPRRRGSEGTAARTAPCYPRNGATRVAPRILNPTEDRRVLSRDGSHARNDHHRARGRRGVRGR